jgi:predicted membrane channel-forming protein YqfA (hemolysin III family)
MRFVGSFAIIFLMLTFVLGVLPPASSEPPGSMVGQLFGQDFLLWQRIALGAAILLLTLWIAFVMPPYDTNIWQIRVFLFFLILALPLIVLQVVSHLIAQESLAEFGIVLCGIWMFVLGGITYRSRIREAFWLTRR